MLLKHSQPSPLKAGRCYNCCKVLLVIVLPDCLGGYTCPLRQSGLKVDTHETSPCNKSRGQVPSCELAIFASKSSRRVQFWSLRLVPWIQTSLNFWDKSPATCSSKRFVWTVRETSLRDQSLRVNSSLERFELSRPKNPSTFQLSVGKTTK